MFPACQFCSSRGMTNHIFDGSITGGSMLKNRVKKGTRTMPLFPFMLLKTASGGCFRCISTLYAQDARI